MEFLAVVKMFPNDSPTRITFGETGYAEAVKKMCSICGCATTAGLHEYDLLEIVTGGYRVVAQKQSGNIVAPPLLPPPVTETVEGTYTPYSVMRQH